MSGNVISRRRFITAAAVGAAAMTLPAVGSLAAEARKPNVIIIFADDLGYADIGVQGCKDIKTPNIDSIARNGIRCTSGYSSCPVCSPSRAGMLTGRYQQRFGHDHNPGKALDEKPWGLPLKEKTIAQYMKGLGYTTGVIGKWHLGDTADYHPNKRGFDEFYGFIGGMHTYLRSGTGFNRLQRNGAFITENEYLTDAIGREAVGFIDRNKSKPFFLYLPFNAVHQPLDVAAKNRGDFAEITDPKRRRFASVLKSLDDNVGKVLAKVRETGLEKETLIVFLSDNGGPTPGNTSRNDPYKGYKWQVHEGGIRVPFLLQWKGVIPSGKTYRKPVISLDLLPTAVALAGGTPEANLDGVNLLPFLTGKDSGQPHEALYWRFDKDTAVRAGDWKLARREGKGARLFNLADDPKEAKDLAREKPEMVKELSAKWDEWNAKNVKPLWPAIPGPWDDMYW